ncbi:tyrosine-protein phosphatase [Thorsellia anophelis]|uniref:Tyrosine phosphatase family protein n=1 Tax=Thorsellia anophelis DSM 18579 TaxID=1123402 RepID=A0A1I0DRL7_9GAMM|nr:tyrosine-protein phosphatase [Thorsellia anophelis]SET34567.1 Tyrosine phosphatase family protein [Thorsellia anophelis DSM 18579]
MQFYFKKMSFIQTSIVKLFSFKAQISLGVMMIMTSLPIWSEDSFPIPNNFYPVTEGIFRSGQPNALEMQGLEAMGIKSVLNLRQWHSDTNEAEGTNLQLSRVPMDAADVNDDNIVEALRILKTAEKPVLIHCWHGSDRTGAVVAMYRLVFEDTPREEVLAELRKPEYGYHYNIYANIERYIEHVDIDAIRARVMAP